MVICDVMSGPEVGPEAGCRVTFRETTRRSCRNTATFGGQPAHSLDVLFPGPALNVFIYDRRLHQRLT